MSSSLKLLYTNAVLAAFKEKVFLLANSYKFVLNYSLFTTQPAMRTRKNKYQSWSDIQTIRLIRN